MTCRATKQGLVLIWFGFARLGAEPDFVFSFKACMEVTRSKNRRWTSLSGGKSVKISSMKSICGHMSQNATENSFGVNYVHSAVSSSVLLQAVHRNYTRSRTMVGILLYGKMYMGTGEHFTFQSCQRASSQVIPHVRAFSLVPRLLPYLFFFFAGEEPGYEATCVHMQSNLVFQDPPPWSGYLHIPDNTGV